jgi:hypothetical protein
MSVKRRAAVDQRRLDPAALPPSDAEPPRASPRSSRFTAQVVSRQLERPAA